VSGRDRNMAPPGLHPRAFMDRDAAAKAEGPNVAVLASSGVRGDRSDVIRWCRKADNSKTGGRRVGGVVSVWDKSFLDGSSRRHLRSITSGELRWLPMSLTDREALDEVYEWAREEIMCALDAGVETLFFDEIGPEVVYGFGLDAALRACLWKAGEEELSTQFVAVVDPSIVEEFASLYGIPARKQLPVFPTFRAFSRWEVAAKPLSPGGSFSPRGIRPTLSNSSVGASMSSNSYGDTSIDRDGIVLSEEPEEGVYEHSHFPTGPFYSIVRFPLLAATTCIILFELGAYIFVRQLVSIIEGLSRSNSAIFKQMRSASHYSSWRRSARRLDLLENKDSGNVFHIPTLHEFCISIRQLRQQLAVENRHFVFNANEEKKEANSGVSVSQDPADPMTSASDFSDDSQDGQLLTHEHELLGCIRACTSTFVELVNEHMYSMNYVGSNVQMRECVELYCAALDDVDKSENGEVLKFRGWQMEKRRLLADESEHLPLLAEAVESEDILPVTVKEPLSAGKASISSKSSNASSRAPSLGSSPYAIADYVESASGKVSGKDAKVITQNPAQQLDTAFKVCKLRFFQEVAHTYGETALCLSGGAANAYFHLGVVKTLVERNLLPRHLTGASGGALVGAFVSTRTIEELETDLQAENLCKVFQPCSQGFKGLLSNLAHMGTLFDIEDWIRKMKSLVCGDMTFREAFERTGRSFTITVYNIDPRGRNHTRVLNYKTTPDVVIYSAVLASSALPKLLPAIELLRKDERGNVTAYHSFGKFWRDGSFENELPFEALRQLFNVTFPIVSQVEPHIVPFFYDNRGSAGKSVSHRKGRGWRGGFALAYVERLLKLDLRKWLELVREFNLLPKVYETDMSSIFLGKSRGAVTLVPRVRVKSYAQIMSDPNTPQKMNYYLYMGAQMTFPKLAMIQDRLEIERTLQQLAAPPSGRHSA